MKYAQPGEWDSEPDELDWQDEKTGFDCRIVRHKESGHLCGYVRVPDGHPLHGLGYSADLPESLKPLKDSVMEGPVGKRSPIAVFCMAGDLFHCGDLFNVHGGVTYSGELRNREGQWYGFDCAHCDDISPGMRRYYSDDSGREYRNIDYVKAECASLAYQLKQVGA